MCIWFGYNPYNFCHFFHFVNFVIFWPQILWKCIDSGYLVSATPYTISCLSLCNFAHLFFHGLKMCMWFGFNIAVNFCHFSNLLSLSFFAGATSTFVTEVRALKYTAWVTNKQKHKKQENSLVSMTAACIWARNSAILFPSNLCLKVKYKGILFYEILMDCVARKRMQKTTSNYLKWFPRYCDLNFTYYLINIHEFIYDIIVEHWNLWKIINTNNVLCENK